MRFNSILAPALVLCCSVFFFVIDAEAKSMSLKKAMKAKVVAIRAVSNGGAVGKCLTLQLINRLNEPLDITVDPGLIFTPCDTNFQHLVAVGGEAIVLQPNERAQLKLQTFCGKSYARGPLPDMQYDFWKQGDSVMIKVSSYITQHLLFNNIGQHAIWTLTNNHPIRTIYDPWRTEASKAMAAYIAELKHVPLPEYYTHYELDNKPGAASPIIYSSGKQYVDINWKHNEGYRHMYVTVYKENGEVYRQVTGNEVIDREGHKVSVVFDPGVDKPGNYHVELHDDANNVWLRKTVRVERTIDHQGLH